MSKLLIEPEIDTFLYDNLQALRGDESEVTISCPHCHVPVRYPLIARESDVRDFQLIMKWADEVLTDMGVTAHAITMIKTRCHLELLKRGEYGKTISKNKSRKT